MKGMKRDLSRCPGSEERTIKEAEHIVLKKKKNMLGMWQACDGQLQARIPNIWSLDTLTIWTEWTWDAVCRRTLIPFPKTEIYGRVTSLSPRDGVCSDSMRQRKGLVNSTTGQTCMFPMLHRRLWTNIQD